MRHDKRVQEREHDPYRVRRHLDDPTVCPDCSAVYRDGRWTWASGPADAPRVHCPACQRIRDRYPAGFITLRGPFFAAHRDEILGLVRHTEERQKAEHPLERVMAIEEQEGGVLVTTTDLHVAHGIANAIHHAYKGSLHTHYVEEDTRLRATWER